MEGATLAERGLAKEKRRKKKVTGLLLDLGRCHVAASQEATQAHGIEPGRRGMRRVLPSLS